MIYDEDVVKYFLEKRIIKKIKRLEIIHWPSKSMIYYETEEGDEYSLKFDFPLNEDVRNDYIKLMRIKKLESI